MHRSPERSGKGRILTRSDSTPSKNIMSALMMMKGKSGLQHPISVNLTKYARKSCSSLKRTNNEAENKDTWDEEGRGCRQQGRRAGRAGAARQLRGCC